MDLKVAVRTGGGADGCGPHTLEKRSHRARLLNVDDATFGSKRDEATEVDLNVRQALDVALRLLLEVRLKLKCQTGLEEGNRLEFLADERKSPNLFERLWLMDPSWRA